MSSARRAPEAFGKYQIIATLATGGMAEVFLAALRGPAGFNKLQVIKRLRPNLAEDPDIQAMFLDEARLAARLNHRNIVQTNEVDIVDGEYFIAMEHLEGQPLSRLLRHLAAPLPLSFVVRILSDVLAGLHHAHELRDYDGLPLHVVHRDISPHNVFITYDGQIKIVDFGIAKAERRAIETGVGVVKGKVQYMAPEQAFAAADVDRRADLFSVGAILWEVIIGRRLWYELSGPEIIAAFLEGIPSIATAKPDVDPEIARVCDRALAFRKEDRYATAADLRADLERLGASASPDEVGALLQQLFRDEQAELRATIEKQVSALLQGDVETLLDLAPRSRSFHQRPKETTPEVPIPRSVTPAPATLDALRDEGKSSLPTVGAGPPAKPGGRRMTSGVLTLAALAAYLVFALHRAGPPLVPSSSATEETLLTPPVSAAEGARPAPSTSVAAAPPPAPSVSSAVAAALPDDAYVHLRIAVNPANARIVVDGNAFPLGAFDGRFRKDGKVHKVMIEADEFRPQFRSLVFDRDIDLKTTLRPLSGGIENERK